MYKILDRSALIYLAIIFVGLGFVATWLIVWPETMTEWIRVVFTLPAAVGMLTFAIGGTRAWRWIWKKFPVLNMQVFPDLNGVWKTEMASNIKAIAEYHPELIELDTAKINSVILGEFKIKQNWFGINIRFDGEDDYSNSDTIFVLPQRDKETGRLYLTYVFRNLTPDNAASDEQTHMGAARVEISDRDGFRVMRGYYWTNRNWKRGLNTAGSITVTKSENALSENSG